MIDSKLSRTHKNDMREVLRVSFPLNMTEQMPYPKLRKVTFCSRIYTNQFYHPPSKNDQSNIVNVRHIYQKRLRSAKVIEREFYATIFINSNLVSLLIHMFGFLDTFSYLKVHFKG